MNLPACVTLKNELAVKHGAAYIKTADEIFAASGVEGRGFESRRVYHLSKNPCKKSKNQSLQTGLQTVFLFLPLSAASHPGDF